MRRTAITLSLSLVSLFCFTQTVEPSASIDKKTLQIELESIYGIEKDQEEKTTTLSIPNTLFRYGLFNNIELQLSIPFIKEYSDVEEELENSIFKIDDLQLGFAVNLWEQNRLKPEASLMVRAFIPSSGSFQIDNMGSIVSFNFKNDLTEELSLNYNLGFIHETDNSNQALYIANLSYKLNDRFHFFLENYGDFTMDYNSSLCLNIGGGYNFKENLSLDCSVARGLDEDTYYFGAILVWIINPSNPAANQNPHVNKINPVPDLALIGK